VSASSRSRANHALYLARILLAAWRRELERQDLPVATLEQAFYPAIRAHLLAAYGWFLLAVSQSEPPVGELPQRCDELPAPPTGRVMPPEISEFRRLESEGWLRDLLHCVAPQPAPPRQPGNLALARSEATDLGQLQHWLQELESLFARMGDSLDEY
jgi:hypothetical protein